MLGGGYWFHIDTLQPYVFGRSASLHVSLSTNCLHNHTVLISNYVAEASVLRRLRSVRLITQQPTQDVWHWWLLLQKCWWRYLSLISSSPGRSTRYPGISVRSVFRPCEAKRRAIVRLIPLYLWKWKPSHSQPRYIYTVSINCTCLVSLLLYSNRVSEPKLLAVVNQVLSLLSPSYRRITGFTLINLPHGDG